MRERPINKCVKFTRKINKHAWQTRLSDVVTMAEGAQRRN